MVRRVGDLDIRSDTLKAASSRDADLRAPIRPAARTRSTHPGTPCLANQRHGDYTLMWIASGLPAKRAAVGHVASQSPVA